METKNLKKPLGLAALFFAILSCLFIFSLLFPYSVNLIYAIGILLFGNFLITILTQVIPFFLLDNSSSHLFKRFRDVGLRCSAGILEMILFTTFFTAGLTEIIVGYLVLKTVSVWKPLGVKKGKQGLGSPTDPKYQEGLSTASLRIAVVLSLIFSLFSSYFLGVYVREKGFKSKDPIYSLSVSPLPTN